MKTILHPGDHSTFANQALPVAVALAKSHGARLLLLHVIEQAGPITELLFAPAGRPDYRYTADKAFHELKAIDSEFPASQVDSGLILGPIAESILKVAGE